MHARLTVATVRPDHVDEDLAAIQETFPPAAQEQPGYQGFLLLTDRASGQLVGISFWESKAAMQSSGGTGGHCQQRMADFSALLTEPPTTTHEVAMREPSSGGGADFIVHGGVGLGHSRAGGRERCRHRPLPSPNILDRPFGPDDYADVMIWRGQHPEYLLGRRSA